MAAERNIQNESLIALSLAGCKVFRQNTGMGWVGKIVAQTEFRIVLENYRPLHAGLCTGSSDIIGWRPVLITPKMVGQTVAVFLAVENKTQRGRASGPQKHFIQAVLADGGLAGVARSADEAVVIADLPQ